MKKTCSWWLISYLEVTCVTICSRMSTSMKELLNCTFVSWHFPWIICRDTTSFTGEWISFEEWAACFWQSRGILSQIWFYSSVFPKPLRSSCCYSRVELGSERFSLKVLSFCLHPFSSLVSFSCYFFLLLISCYDVHFSLWSLNTKDNL